MLKDTCDTGTSAQSKVAAPKAETNLIDSFVQRAILILAILGIPALVVSLSRVDMMGWRPLFVMHVVILLAAWVLVILRRRISPRARITAFTTLPFVLGLIALVQLGYAGQGPLILGLACMLAASIYGLRKALLTFALSAVSILCVLFAISRGILSLGFDPLRYLQSPNSFLALVTVFLLVGGAAICLAGATRDELGRSLEGLQDRTAELELAIDALNQEVQERRGVEEHLRASEAQFQSVFSQAAVGIGIQSREGEWVQANDRACAIFGYSAEELVGRSFMQMTYADDVEKSRIAFKALADRSTDRVSMEKRYIHRNGSIIWANTYASVVRDKDGSPLFHVVVIEDITDRRRIEEEKRQFYREAISSITDGRLQILSADESEAYEQKSTVRVRIESASQLAAARQQIQDYCELRGLSGDTLALYMVGLGEAGSNALKHAGSGEAFAGSDGDQVWVGVTDKGPGIATFALPRATLGRRYSTKLSMGFGYSIMLNVADQIMLSTGSMGTRLILVKRLSSSQPELRLEDLRDTWDSI